MITINQMETKTSTLDRVLMMMLKEPFITHTATSIAKTLKITRQGVWKALNKLNCKKLIIIETVGSTRTSTATIKLNWSNPSTEKTLSLILTEEALKQERWRVNFTDMENNSIFLMLFGSILTKPKEANDIDLLAAVDKLRFKEVEQIVARVQKTQLKKIHLIAVTKKELSNELIKQNNTFIDAIKKGVILFGQDDFIKFVKNHHSLNGSIRHIRGLQK